MAGGEGVQPRLEAERGLKGAGFQEQRPLPAERMLEELRAEAAEVEGRQPAQPGGRYAPPDV
jgi:hypothetical protein